MLMLLHMAVCLVMCYPHLNQSDLSLAGCVYCNLSLSLIRETWDTSRMPPPAAMMVNASRVSWAAKQASLDAREKLGEAAESLSSSLSSMEEGDQTYRDPTDPTKVQWV